MAKKVVAFLRLIPSVKRLAILIPLLLLYLLFTNLGFVKSNVIAQYFGEYSGQYFGQYSGQYFGQYTGQYFGQYTSQYTTQYPGQYFGQYTSQYTSEYPSQYFGQYTTQYTNEYPTEYPSQYFGQYPGEYPTEYPSQYFGVYPSEYPSEYPGQYFGVYPSEYTTQYTTEYTSEYPSEYPSQYFGQYTTQYSSQYPSEYDTEFTPPPPPQSEGACKNPLSTAQLTKITSHPYSHVFKRFVPAGVPTTTFQEPLDIHVNFAELPAIFAGPNSDYLESRFQNQSHNQAETTNLNSQDFNSFHGPGQKAAPLYQTDDLKIKYIQYLAQKPTLDENNDVYSDANGNNPRKITDLISSFGASPQPPSHGGNQTTWSSTWGPYWDKIPTAVNEYYYAFIAFMPPFEGQKEIQRYEATRQCTSWDRTVFFVLPNYFRTTSVANQANQLIVPKVAQSSSANFVDTNLFASKKDSYSKFSQILGPFGKSISEIFKKIFKISLNPVKIVMAQEIPTTDQCPSGLEKKNSEGPCEPITTPQYCARSLPILPTQKPGEGPFCSMPADLPGPDNSRTTWEQFFPNSERAFMPVLDPLRFNNLELFNQRISLGLPEEPQRYSNESCLPNPSAYNLDGGALVDCTFKRDYTRTLAVPNDPLWDYCEPVFDPETGLLIGYECQLTVNIYLVYWVPWLAPIWNNTTASDKAEETEQIVYGTTQETGRPGIFNSFTPKVAEGAVFSDASGKKLPSQDKDDTTAPKQRFFGAVDNFKKFVRDCALKPIALQSFFGITCKGDFESEPPPPTPSPTPSPTPKPVCIGGDGWNCANLCQSEFVTCVPNQCAYCPIGCRGTQCLGNPCVEQTYDSCVFWCQTHPELCNFNDPANYCRQVCRL